ncbi:ribosomal L28 family-domain-containing protein [Microdochium bolleyi]|uniref:Large ribosomal subunit protein bL28m n=1 Tax=Microdochium bolleyi TaxID=196109 RepID=A0A136IQ36_9PEZI|nr:ribosomal L28 family-domain-containing protein [Microdochium bolleyi]
MAPSIRPLFAAATTSTTRCLAHAHSHAASTLPLTAARCLSTTAALSRQKPSHRTVDPELLPEYPYGRFRTYKQANEGLYGGAKVRFGNVISEKWNRKSRTKWLPNRHTKRLWSVGLQNFIRVRLTARTLRTIDKLGGIDEYLLGPKAARVKEMGPAGWALRWKVMQSPIIQERYAREREALGLPPRAPSLGGVDGGALEFPPDVLAQAARQTPGGRTAEDLMRDINAMLEKGEEFELDAESESDLVLSTEDQRILDDHASPENKRLLQEIDDMIKQEEASLKSEAPFMMEEEKPRKP